MIGGLLGGKKATIPASGFYAMPQEYQDLWKSILGQTQGVAGTLNPAAFTPMGKTVAEQAALDQISRGIAPTEESLRADIRMLMNPYDEFVEQGLNREAAGRNSLVQQASQRAGQMGSNRQFLGTSDVEQVRLNQIGQQRQNQYNTAVDRALGQLAGLRQQDIDNRMQSGSFERGLDLQTKQAPYAALSANQGALGGIPTQFDKFGQEARTVKSGGGLGGLLSAVAPMALNAIAPGAGSALSAGMGGGIGGSLAGWAAGRGLTGGLDPSTGINWKNSSWGFF